MTLKIPAELLPPKPWQSWLEIVIACPQARNATIKIETTGGYDNLYADTIAWDQKSLPLMRFKSP